MRTQERSTSAFTLVEMLVALSVVVILGGVAFALLNLGMTLYAQNSSINKTQAGGLASTEKILVKVAAALEAPVLVDDAGAPVVGNGPAAGIHFFSPASPSAYSVPSAVTATATSFVINKSAGQPAPVAGDRILMADLGFKAVITSVSGSGTSYTVGFGSSVGDGFSPAKTSGTVIPAASKCFLLAPSAFISVDSGLRHYPRALSVAQNGAPAFNNPANFDQSAALLPVGTQTNCFPFQYLDAEHRSVDVNLRIRAPAHGGRVRDFYTFQNIKTTVAYRSATGK